MKKNEVIELNGKEYVLELNRESAIRIEQYTNYQKNIREIAKPILDYKEEISEDEDPFKEEIDFEKIEQDAETKLKTLQDMISKAFWIWLYPNHKLNIGEVKKLIIPYFDKEEDIEFISSKYNEYMKLSTEINQKYIQEQKNLKAQANK